VLNLIFDLGGVVVRWDPDAIIAGVFQDPGVRKRVREGVFGHPDWLELDRGTLEREDAIRRAARRLGMPDAEIRRLLVAVPPSLVPIPEIIRYATHRLILWQAIAAAIGAVLGVVISIMTRRRPPTDEHHHHEHGQD